MPYDDVRYVPVFDSEIAYGKGLLFFVRFGRVNAPLAMETKMRRPRIAFGVSLETGSLKANE